MLKVRQPDVKVWLIGKDLMLGMIEGRRRRDDRGWDGWMASLTQGTWFEQALGAGNGQGSLECCSSWGCKESEMTKELNWTELKSKCKCTSLSCVQLFVTPCTIWSMEFSRPEYWSGSPLPSPGDCLNPGIKPRPPAVQADSLPAEPQGKPKNTGVGSLSFLQQIFLTQELNQGLLHCRQILYQLSYQGSPKK